MNRRPIRALFVLFLPLLLTACGTNGFYSTAVVTEGIHEIPRGETVDGLLLVLDGRVHVQEGATVAGAIYLLDGVLTLDGSAAGDVAQFGGELIVGDGASIAGDLRQAGGEFSLDPGAIVQGRLLRGSDLNLELRPEQAEESLATRLGWTLIQTLALALLAAWLARIAPRPLGRVADAVSEHPLVSLALGILVGIVAPSLLVVMAFTILLIPVTVVGMILGGAVVAYGLIAWGFVLARLIVRRWPALSLPLAAFLGTALFMILIEAITVVPLVGGLIPLLLAVTGVGAVLLTRFGRQRFVPATERVVAERSGTLGVR
jgi:hypothetical protein